MTIPFLLFLPLIEISFSAFFALESNLNTRGMVWEPGIIADLEEPAPFNVSLVF